MKIQLIGSFVTNHPYGTEIAFLKGLRRIGGHDLHVVDPNIPGQVLKQEVDATIVFKTAKEYNSQLVRVAGLKVVYQPDDYRFPHIQQMMAQMRRFCDYALTFDSNGASQCKKIGYKNAKCLVVTADDELYHPLNVAKDLDLCFVGSLSGGPPHRSRQKMMEALVKAGLRVSYMSGVFDIPKIVDAYNRAKVVLNHATDVGQSFGSGYGYQCRHFEVGMTRSCLLSNSVKEVEPGYELANFFTFSSEDELVEKANDLLSLDSFREEAAERYYLEIRERHLPEHRAQDIVRFLQECGT